MTNNNENEENKMNLTEKETVVLNAMRKGMDEPFKGWLHELNIPFHGKQLSGIVSSLSTKGAIICGEEKEPGMEPCFFYEVEEAFQTTTADEIEAAIEAVKAGDVDPLADTEEKTDSQKREESNFVKACKASQAEKIIQVTPEPVDSIGVMIETPSKLKTRLELMNEEKALLTPYFEKVQPKTHWKDPIDGFCRTEEAHLVGRAIEFFTATTTTFGKTDVEGWVSVKSIGYRAGEAGDH